MYINLGNNSHLSMWYLTLAGFKVRNRVIYTDKWMYAWETAWLFTKLQVWDLKNKKSWDNREETFSIIIPFLIIKISTIY